MKSFCFEGKVSFYEVIWLLREVYSHEVIRFRTLGIVSRSHMVSKGRYLPMKSYVFERKVSTHEVLSVRKEGIYP